MGLNNGYSQREYSNSNPSTWLSGAWIAFLSCLSQRGMPFCNSCGLHLFVLQRQKQASNIINSEE
jgi:hypothetical protein